MFLILRSDFTDLHIIEEIGILSSKLIKNSWKYSSTSFYHYYNIILDILYYYSYISLISRKEYFLCLPLSKDSLYEFWTYIKPYSDIKIMEFHSLNEVLSFLKTIKYKETNVTYSYYFLLKSYSSLTFLIHKLFTTYFAKYVQKIFNENVKDDNNDYHYHHEIQNKCSEICHSLFVLPFFIIGIQEYLTGEGTIFLNKNDIPFDTISIYFINNFYLTDIATIYSREEKRKILSKFDFHLIDKNANEKFNIYKVNIPLILLIKFILEKIINILENPIEIDPQLDLIIKNMKDFAVNILSKQPDESSLLYINKDIIKVIDEGLKRFPKYENNINLPEIIINELFDKVRMILGKRRINNVVIDEICQSNDKFGLSILLKNLFDKTQEKDVTYIIYDKPKSVLLVNERLNIGFKLLTSAI